MEENIYLSALYDYYKNLLTEKQQAYFEDYYFDNLSLSEIGENYNISRNAVSKQLRSIKEKLLEYEHLLQLYYKREKIKSILTENEYNKIEQYLI